MRFLYFYLMKGDPSLIRELATDHARYWRSLGLNDYQGGPFADRSGGLILFDAAAELEAGTLVGNDPFQTGGAIDSFWVKRWIPEAAPTENVVVGVGGGGERKWSSRFGSSE